MSVSKTPIEWTDSTWSPIRGCSRVSPGCDHCYAMGQAHRFDHAGRVVGNGVAPQRQGEPGPYHGLTTIRRGKVDWSGVVRFVPEMLDRPLRWRKPRRIFVDSMSDLFHESLTNEQIDRVFGAMWACLHLGRDAAPGHIFQILTKRAKRMREYLSTDRREKWAYAAVAVGGGVNPDALWDQTAMHVGPHPRIWLGVSAEDQQRADERIPELLACPAAIRFVSAEPLLGPLDLSGWLFEKVPWGIDWVIPGGESGPGARPCALEWIESIVRQCKDAGVACFVKQLGGYVVSEERTAPLDVLESFRTPIDIAPNGEAWAWRAGLKHRKGGDPSEWPEDLRVREFPEFRRCAT